jgi:hypothetical protein
MVSRVKTHTLHPKPSHTSSPLFSDVGYQTHFRPKAFSPLPYSLLAHRLHPRSRTRRMCHCNKKYISPMQIQGLVVEPFRGLVLWDYAKALVRAIAGDLESATVGWFDCPTAFHDVNSTYSFVCYSSRRLIFTDGRNVKIRRLASDRRLP